LAGHVLLPDGFFAPQSWDDLRYSLRWLYAAFALALAWATLQIPYVIHFHQKYFKLINSLQSYLSTRKLITTRISGPTYEPKWFAEQICFLLMPWLLSSVLSGRSIFPWRYRWITVEWFLLAWSAVVLVFTYSRTGLFILVVLAFLSYWLYRRRSLKALSEAHPARRSAWRVVEAIAIISLLAGGIFLVGSQNAYFSRLWRYWTEGKARTRTYLEFIAFEQRFVYWSTAMRIYDQNPLLGVGLSNYAFYFPDMLPNQPYDEQREVMRQITPGEGRDRLITPKNLYARLIAETGLLGTVLFTVFILAMIGCILFLWFSPHLEQKYWATSGLFALVVFTIIVFRSIHFPSPICGWCLKPITAAAHLDDPAEGQAGQPVSPV
jgi:O-antigen ligase